MRIFVYVVFAFLASQAGAVETVKWDRDVIQVELIVGTEQMIFLPGPATVGIPAELASDNVFRHLFASNTAYWKAMQPFSTQRIKVRLDESGEFVLFDVSARMVRQPPVKVEPLRVVVERASEDRESEQNSASVDPEITMFDVLRYAAQVEYAPERVVQGVPGIRTLENKVNADLSRLYNHRDSRKLDMAVEEMFSADGWYVTSIRITNGSSEAVTIEPSRIQHTSRSVVNGVGSHFVASAMVYRTVQPRGSALDTTYLYVVTDRPFASVIVL